MNLQSKIILSNTALLVIFTLALAFLTDTWPGNGFFYLLGFIGLAGGIGSLILGILLLFRKDKRPARGYLISSLLLLAISGMSYFFFYNY